MEKKSSKAKKPQISQLDRAILKEFAAEITRITHYPLSDDTVNRAIEAVKPKMKQEE